MSITRTVAVKSGNPVLHVCGLIVTRAQAASLFAYLNTADGPPTLLRELHWLGSQHTPKGESVAPVASKPAPATVAVTPVASKPAPATVKPALAVIPAAPTAPPVASVPAPATVKPAEPKHNAKGELLPRFRHSMASADATVTLQGKLYGRIEGRTYTWTVCAKLADHWRTYRGSFPIAFADSAPAPTPPSPRVTVTPAPSKPAAAPTLDARITRAELIGIVDGVEGIITLFTDDSYEFVACPVA